jgi:tetratricopeptide (TPR) repeat protein
MPARSETVDDAWSLLARGQYRGAAEISARLLQGSPDDFAALSCNAVSNWQLGGDIAVVLRQMRRAAALAPELSSIWHNLGMILASAGDIEGARASFLKAIELRPDDTEAFYGLSQNQRFTEETDLVRRMLDLYSTGGLDRPQREFACFALAKVFNDLARPKRAMHFCLEANWLAQRPYEADKARADLVALRRMTAAGALRHIPAADKQTAAPVFVVGMPRSGTTLVESVLARHPDVYAGGEMLHMFNVEQALLGWARQEKQFSGSGSELLRLVPQAYFEQNADVVLRKVQEAAGRPFQLFTDKLPENTQRLGLIAKLFPKARVIYVRRHALDCCISNLFQRFTLGHGFAFRQDLLGERYRQVAETMRLWKQSLDIEIVDVRYEALVTDPEPEIRRLIAFAGLEWNDACLTPERADRKIMTASQFQVKQPINQQSVDRWRAYEEWIQPLIASLGGLEWIEAEARG